jgi:predicted negative regulator of RcsB-dependent stress response
MRPHRLFFGLLLTAGAASAAPHGELRDLYFGEALYDAYQGEWFDAIARLDTELGQYRGVDEPGLDPLHFHINDAEFSVGDFEISYRMHNRASRAIKAVMDAKVAPAVRNEAGWRLARLQLQKGRPLEAQQTLDRIEGEVPESIRDDLAFLRAQVLMANGHPDQAVTILQSLQQAKGLQGFSSYNLGVALLQAGREEEGRAQLDRAGLVDGGPDTQAIRDKSNLVLGTQLLTQGQYVPARQYLERVRLSGPFSNRALLGAGWADASEDRYEGALVPWTILAQRNVTDQAVQEGLLAVPYAYGKLNVHGKAALLYARALDAFGGELTRLDASIASVREGKFLQMLVREELKQDRDWVIKLRNLPEAPETWYLTELMASDQFQESLKNYLDLEALRLRLEQWGGHLDSWEQLVELRRAYYEPLLPEIDREFRRLDSQMRLRLEQREHVAKRLNAMLVAPRPDFLATGEERGIREGLVTLEQKLGTRHDAEAERLRARIARLRGVLHWRFVAEYGARLTAAHAHLRQLDRDIAELNRRYQSFIRARQAATQSYEGYGETLRGLKNRTRDSQEKVNLLLARQGQFLEEMTLRELELRRRRVEEFQSKARFAMADSYDRATRARDAGRPAP